MTATCMPAIRGESTAERLRFAWLAAAALGLLCQTTVYGCVIALALAGNALARLRQREMSDEELRCAARGLARREGRDIVLVLNREIAPWGELDRAGSRTGAIVSTEDYHLYSLRHGRLEETAPAAQCAGEVP